MAIAEHCYAIICEPLRGDGYGSGLVLAEYTESLSQPAISKGQKGDSRDSCASDEFVSVKSDHEKYYAKLFKGVGLGGRAVVGDAEPNSLTSKVDASIDVDWYDGMLLKGSGAVVTMLLLVVPSVFN